MTVKPAVGLEDASVVTATGTGFQPGESVAMVQCAIEAGRPAKGGEAAGIDGCDISVVVYADADQDGVASGRFQVRSTISTPVTGTTDCTARPDRCIVAMAAAADYDRSGAGGLTFGPAPEPDPNAPGLTVEPSTGLADAQVVHVVATGLPASTAVGLEVCSVDPAGCWSTGSHEDPGAGLITDADGRLVADVPVWRYLPGPEPRTYIDCALSVCDLILTIDGPGAGPPPAHLAFSPGGEGPVGAALTVEPDVDIEPGSTVIVRGAGFGPSATVLLSLCITADSGDQLDGLCVDLGDALQPDADGTFEIQVVVPGVEDLGGDQLAAPSTTGASTTTAGGSQPCDGVSTRCVVRASLGVGDPPGGPLRPRFGPDPVPVTYTTTG